MKTPHQTQTPTKSPRLVLERVFAFPPNRETLGGTSYFIVENPGNILIDCPAWTQEYEAFLQDQGGVRWLFLTHRGGIGKRVEQMQQALGCEVVIQEQEAYLLPGVEVTTFEKEFHELPHCQAVWTPGFSPGSSCLYYEKQGGVLFCGRHLLPNQQGEVSLLRTGKTFHWFRQLRSLETLRNQFSPQYLCPGANTGFLRGRGVVEDAAVQLAALDVTALRQSQPMF
jgi:glyoxylase-like metal-dependent hydrolase (beta-lactamase superfamily II)